MCKDMLLTLDLETFWCVLLASHTAKYALLTWILTLTIMTFFFLPFFSFFFHSVIWDLSDMDKDGMLDLEEFTVAMHLCDKTKAGEELPDVLPRDMIPPSKVSLVL